jgi:hypothetical protein
MLDILVVVPHVEGVHDVGEAQSQSESAAGVRPGGPGDHLGKGDLFDSTHGRETRRPVEHAG